MKNYRHSLKTKKANQVYILRVYAEDNIVLGPWVLQYFAEYQLPLNNILKVDYPLKICFEIKFYQIIPSGVTVGAMTISSGSSSSSNSLSDDVAYDLNGGIGSGNVLDQQQHESYGVAILLMILMILCILVYFCWSAYVCGKFCKLRSVCCRIVDEEEAFPRGLAANDTATVNRNAQLRRQHLQNHHQHHQQHHQHRTSMGTPTIILLPHGRMLVVDGSIFTQLNTDSTGELTDNLVLKIIVSD